MIQKGIYQVTRTLAQVAEWIVKLINLNQDGISDSRTYCNTSVNLIYTEITHDLKHPQSLLQDSERHTNVQVN